MSKGSGVIRGFINGIRQLVGSESKHGTLIGADQFGNKYYEGDTERKGKRPRKVISLDEDMYNPPKVPTEWLTWLQHRRVHPPTEQEMMKNKVYTARTLQRAAELDKAREGEEKTDELGASDNDPPKYPDYKEYEKEPGLKYKPKDDDR